MLYCALGDTSEKKVACGGIEPPEAHKLVIPDGSQNHNPLFLASLTWFVLFVSLKALCSLVVHKLVIPATNELTHTWTAVFGFTALEESVRREMRSMNMLVFPGIPMLQKVRKHGCAKQSAPRSNDNTPGVASGFELGSSSGIDTQEYDDGVLHHSSRINGETAAADSDSQCPNVSVKDTCGNSGSLDKSPEPNGETTLADYQTTDSRNVSRLDSKYDANPGSSHDALEMQNKAGLDYPAEDNQSDDGTDSRSGDKETESTSGDGLAKPASPEKSLCNRDGNYFNIGSSQRLMQGGSETDDAELSDCTLMALRYHELADQRKGGN
ncbi:hypothetical protein F3Y22_tig00111621pilonHSYRG00571 [Hibiscus syriacus]|uniref:Increased DNA methylation 1 C-terminal domain-containing protein n=1 Tax=Hibiscus syriacus TaxID=106335 RepID=A0A6A2XJC6_HIBSY|nr:hypothetical protein F3Y22_tig00111621pilonHSYRG00571 [Hibiscus syriacus]